MRRTNTKRVDSRGRKSSAKGSSQGEASASLVDAWWATVLAGDVTEPHPIFGDVKVQLRGGLLRLSGELESVPDRDELVRQARQRIGHGIDSLDVSGLRNASRREKPGILEQTLISAFPSTDAAEFARDFVIKHSRVVPKLSEIVDPHHADRLKALIPEGFVPDARKALDGGHALLILTIDETEAFRVRELLEEDTRSEWTIATPPQLFAASRRG
jgi:hypothetical protein